MAGLMEIRRRMMTRGNTLPPAYTKCDYVQSTGGKARIDTGVPGNDSTLKITGDIKVMDFGAYNAMLGNHTSDSYKSWRIIQPKSSTETNIICGTYKHISTIVSVASGAWQNVPFRFQFLLEYGYAEITINGTTTSMTAADDGKTDNNANLAIGSRNPSVASGTATHRFYGVRIYRNGILIRDYRPCTRKSDQKAGFYDTVNHTFNPSIGTADFAAGND